MTATIELPVDTHIIELIVNDSQIDSDPDSVTVEVLAQPSGTVISEILLETIELIDQLDADAFKNKKRAIPLTNKLNDILDMLEGGDYDEALSKLENDILKKTDGCAKKHSPDKNDWITNCSDQEQIYSALMEVIVMLREMI